jgi:carbonic anhydrase/acetyltransferase-like protein (isoleucine patch superfamily)
MAGKDAFARGRRAGRAVAWWLAHRLWQGAQWAGKITADTPAGHAFASFGAGSVIGFPTGALYGQAWIMIGTGTLIGEQVSLSAGMVPGQDLGGEPVLRIGDRCVVGRGSHIVAHRSIVIGNDVYTGPYVYITDQNHSYADPELPIGAGSWLGAGAIVLPGACIGRNVVVAAGSVVRGRVPDRCVVAGVPARVVREYVTGNGWSRPVPMPGDHG